MDAAKKPVSLSVEEYLEGEQRSEVRHEYVAGALYAMAGASVEHNTISLNLASALRGHLRGMTCRVFMADVLVRFQTANHDIFYYPDVMVVCDPRDTDRFFKRFPKVLIEALSETTERADRREKFLSYTQIETLTEYVLVAQGKMEVVVFRQSDHWKPELLNAPEQRLTLPSLEFTLALSEVYEDVTV
jgi:Uma2 family endonuclease